ncbi:hypothetical protein B0O99DRAFT_646103 [Bisporella sp. PMI_857]|nr:hypothetical protein B0O99DRAFT_646103 [Bisporella sp. PMI_857]
MASFPNFGRFPIKIRLQIWCQAATNPQVVDARFIWHTWTTPNFRSDACQNTTSHLKGILGACRESRHEVIGKFRRNLRRWGSPHNPVLVYFNPAIDTLWFSEHSTKELLQFFLEEFRNGVDQVRYVAYHFWHDDYLDRLVEICHYACQLKRLYLTDDSSYGTHPEMESAVVLLGAKRTPEDEEPNMAEEIRSKCGNPSLVITWKLVKEHVRQVMKERMTREAGSNWNRIIPEMRIGRIVTRESFREHTWTLGCRCESCQRWETNHPGIPFPLSRLP